MKRSGLKRTKGLERYTPLGSTVPPVKREPKPRKPISPASNAQRLKCRDAHCVVCGQDRYDAKIHPAHLIDRSLGGGNHALDVVPLCALHHRAYDDGTLDLLPYLEPRFREELAQAVRHVGLVGALQRVTNDRWSSTEEER